jgi:serine-type D-Ala-D-Ala carboxypeptidase/endopeptidase
MVDWRMPGPLAIARVRSGEPVTVDTTFRVASMTKMFTALGLLHLRDRGKLHFDEPVENIVPELASLRYPTSDCRRIRIRDLLSHVGGFVTDDPWGDRHLDMSEVEFSSLLRSQLPFARAPGIAHEYSNLGFAILGRVISNRSGQRYDTYLHENFLRPLDMPSSTWEVGDIPIERRAVGH